MGCPVFDKALKLSMAMNEFHNLLTHIYIHWNSQIKKIFDLEMCCVGRNTALTYAVAFTHDYE